MVVTDGAGVTGPTVDGWDVVVGFWPLAVWDSATNCPAGEPSGTPTDGVWTAGGFEGSVLVDPGDYVLMAATNDPAAELFASGTNQGFLQVSVAGPDDNFTIELSRTLGEECARTGGP